MNPVDGIARQGRFRAFARLGFLARGILYVTVAALVIGAGRTEDLPGALEYLGRGTGRWLLTLLAAGLAGYGTWRLADAWFGMESGDGPRSFGERAGALVSGVAHMVVAWQAVQLIEGSGNSVADEQDHAALLLDLPGGRFLLGIAALVLLVAAGVQFARAARCSFLESLDDSVRESWCKWLGRIGYAARGVIFLLAAYFLAGAALENEPSAAGGLERALDWLASPLDYLVAAGLLLFGLFSMVEARFRRIRRPPVEAIGR